MRNTRRSEHSQKDKPLRATDIFSSFFMDEPTISVEEVPDKLKKYMIAGTRMFSLFPTLTVDESFKKWKELVKIDANKYISAFDKLTNKKHHWSRIFSGIETRTVPLDLKNLEIVGWTEYKSCSEDDGFVYEKRFISDNRPIIGVEFFIEDENTMLIHIFNMLKTVV